MLKVDRQSGGFTPLNEICPKNYLSLDIPVIPLWQNSCNLSCAIPLGPAPWRYAYVCVLYFTLKEGGVYYAELS